MYTHTLLHTQMYMYAFTETQIYPCIDNMHTHKNIHIYKTLTNQFGNVCARAAGTVKLTHI